jgi:hypothetical protein
MGQRGLHMGIGLLILSVACLLWCAFYVLYSVRSALSAGRRRNKLLIFLEFEPWRARGDAEKARAQLLRRIGLAALFALPSSVVALLASIVMS